MCMPEAFLTPCKERRPSPQRFLPALRSLPNIPCPIVPREGLPKMPAVANVQPSRLALDHPTHRTWRSRRPSRRPSRCRCAVGRWWWRWRWWRAPPRSRPRRLARRRRAAARAAPTRPHRCVFWPCACACACRAAAVLPLNARGRRGRARTGSEGTGLCAPRPPRRPPRQRPRTHPR
jgi:hypothetical protein